MDAADGAEDEGGGAAARASLACGPTVRRDVRRGVRARGLGGGAPADAAYDAAAGLPVEALWLLVAGFSGAPRPRASARASSAPRASRASGGSE